jgi:hypothetical protein
MPIEENLLQPGESDGKPKFGANIGKGFGRVLKKISRNLDIKELNLVKLS